eukprot:35761_1
MMLLISDSLHNSLVILSVLFISFLFFLTLKELRELWQHVHIIYNKSPSSGSSNVLLLQSSQLSDLTDTLSTVDDTIEIHPRQIRRILRQALDSNIIKDVATSQPDSYLKQPTFNKINNEYILRVNHYQKQQQQTDDTHAATDEDTTICFDFYFGVPKSYYFQIQSITNLSNKQNMMSEQGNTNTQSNHTKKHTNDHKKSDNHHESPLKSLMALATTNTELRMERINSKSSFRSKSSIGGMHDVMEMEPANEGIEMMQIATESVNNTQPIKHKSKSKQKHVITLQKLIPNEYVHREFVESKSGEDVHFDEKDLENTIATIIGNIKKRELIKKRGQSTKYQKEKTKYKNESATDAAKSDDEVVNEDGFYFCVLLSYVRHADAVSNKDTKTMKRKAKTSNIVSNLFKKKRTVELQDVDLKCDDETVKDEEKYEECIVDNGDETAINTLEISIFDPPSAFLPRNQHQKQSKKSKKNVIKTNDETILIENALEPRLCFKLLCDFKLQRLVEYYDIFGISSDAAHANANLDCKICFSFPANIVLLPCRHCCCCLSCYKHIEQCPMCRKPIRQTLRWKSEIVD